MKFDVAAIKALPNNARGTGEALVKTFSKAQTQNGGYYYSGALSNLDDIRFMIWDSSQAYRFFESNAIVPGETVLNVSFHTNEYQGSKSIILDTADFSDLNPDEFIVQKYEIDDAEKCFRNSLQSAGASETAISLLEKIISSDEFVNERFKKEFAAMTHHDNCRSGLMMHTVKCLDIYAGLKGNYEFCRDPEINDLFALGIALHDIGKVYEMKNGNYQEFSFITHRELGMEYLLRFKQDICEEYSERFYYLL